MLKFLIFGLLGLYLVSCSPGAFGPGSRSNPLRTSITQVAKVPQNAETFVVTSGPISAITRTQADRALNPLLGQNFPVKGQKFSTEVNWLRVKDVIVPNGIEVTLLKQTATREIGDVGVSSFTIFDSVELVFSVKVASGVKLGASPILVQLSNIDDSSRTGVAALNLEVIAPTPLP